MKKNHRIAPEVREQILNRIKTEGVPIKQIADEHGICDRTIYEWLKKGADGGPSVSEVVKLRKERDELLMLVGELTVRLSQAQKKN